MPGRNWWITRSRGEQNKIECAMLVGYTKDDCIMDPQGAYRLYQAAVNSKREMMEGTRHTHASKCRWSARAAAACASRLGSKATGFLSPRRKVKNSTPRCGQATAVARSGSIFHFGVQLDIQRVEDFDVRSLPGSATLSQLQQPHHISAEDCFLVCVGDVSAQDRLDGVWPDQRDVGSVDHLAGAHFGDEVADGL